MPCSCGCTTCPCGIPCYCSEESCQCDDCAMALRSFCTICNKPLTAGTQIDESPCSCFAEESTALIFENGDNPRFRMGNLPMQTTSDSYVNGQLVFNVRIRVPGFAQYMDQRHFDCMPPPLIQADSGNQLPFASGDKVEALIHPDVESGIYSTTELQQVLDESSKKSSSDAASSIFSTIAQNEKVSTKEDSPKRVLESSEEKTANTNHTTKSEMESTSNYPELCLYLPSFKIDNFSYPVRLEDPVWSLPNFPVSTAHDPYSSLEVCNPFHTPGLVDNIQSDKEHQQLVGDSNFNANNFLRMEPFFGTQEYYGVEPLQFVPVSASGYKDSLTHFGYNSIANCNLQNVLSQTTETSQNERNPDKTSDTIPTTSRAEGLKDLKAMEQVNRSPVLRLLFEKKSGAPTPEKNESESGSHNNFDFENKENDPIQLYIDSFTTQAISKLLKPNPRI